MTSKDLQTHYRAELAKMLDPASREKHVNPKSTRWMIRHAEATEGGEYTPEPGTGTWIWSDLHLHHRNIIRYCNRPFETVDAMNEALLTAWRETVGEADTIVCGGDIALAGALEGNRLAEVRAMPGRKLLVRGNHDFDRKGRAADTGCDETWMTLVVTGDPPLLVTHMAMSAVPEGTVNVHGHVHNNEPLRAGPYVNICVEHTEYRPLPLDAVRRLAQARLDDPRPRAATTAEEIRARRPTGAITERL